MKNPLSLTARISLLFAISAACVLLVAGLLFERAGEKQFMEHDREELDGKMELIRDVLGHLTRPDTLTELPTRLHDAVAGHPGIVITVVANDGTVLFSVGQPEVVKDLLKGIGKSKPATWSLDHHTYRIIANRLALGIPASQPASVAIALDITSDQKFMANFRESLWFGMVLAALAMGWLGWMAVREGLVPLHDVSEKVANVSAQQLGKPLPMTGVPLELQELVSTFNRMMVRLDDTFQRLSEFSSDIAHELRTPINNIMMQTQVTLSRERDAEEYHTNLQSNLEELERLSRMISAMLFLAKADNRLLIPKQDKIDLQEEVGKLFDFYEALASEHRVRMVQRGRASICADRLMIQRALSNLLSNAIRFTPEGGIIDVTLEMSADQVMVTVANPGQEIPAEHLHRIFERLYRVDASRREGQTDNLGLGLAITKSVVEIHGGTISAESAQGRTFFVLTFPLRQVCE